MGGSELAFATTPGSPVTASPNPFWSLRDSRCWAASVFLGHRRQAILGREVPGMLEERPLGWAGPRKVQG